MGAQLSQGQKKILLNRHEEIFENFIDREERLSSITRYSNYAIKKYPTTLRSHQHQVGAVTAFLLEHVTLPHNFDEKKALIMGWIHDDHEPFMKLGDIQSANEVGRSKEVQVEIDKDELLGIKRAAESFPKQIDKYSYEELLLDAAHTLSSKESQFVKLCDKMAGLGEALHEIRNENDLFRGGAHDNFSGRVLLSPLEYYADYFQETFEKLPLVEDLFAGDVSLFLYQRRGKFSQKHYELWKGSILTYAPSWEQERLFG